MQLISNEYRRLNEQLHKDVSEYGKSGQRNAKGVMNLAMSLSTQDILDYGCGKSTLAKNLPFLIRQYDPAIPKYNELPEPAEIVVCTDVLEHIEPDCIDNVLAHLQKLTKQAGYFTIATRPAKKTLADGRNAHLIVEPAIWWLNKLAPLFTIVNFQQHKGECLVIVKPLEEIVNA